MEIAIPIAGGLLYGLCLLLAYRLGLQEGNSDEAPPKALQVAKKPKARPTTKEEYEAAEKQRRIDEFRG